MDLWFLRVILFVGAELTTHGVDQRLGIVLVDATIYLKHAGLSSFCGLFRQFRPGRAEASRRGGDCSWGICCHDLGKLGD